MISGLGCSDFQRCVEGLRCIHSFAKATLPQGFNVHAWKDEEYGGHNDISFANRYFTKASEAGGVGLTSFDNSVDPKHILTHVTQTARPSLVHTLDNQVFYYKRLPAPNGSYDK